MTYSDDLGGWHDVDDEDGLPGLDTEEDRDKWVEILMAQDDESLAELGGWCKALMVADENGNMMTRFVYPDGREEVFDLTVRRAIEVSVAGDRN